MKLVRLFKAYNVSYMVFAQKKVRLFMVVLMHKQRNFRSCGLYIYFLCDCAYLLIIVPAVLPFLQGEFHFYIEY